MRRIVPILATTLVLAGSAFAQTPAPQTPAPRPPAGVLNVARANLPGSANGGYFVEVNARNSNGVSGEVWILNIFPADIVDGAVTVTGYWRRLRFDCKARTMRDVGTAIVDSKGASGATVVDPAAAAMPVTPGTSSDVAFRAACENLRVPGEPYTSLFAAIAASRPTRR